MGDEEAVAEDRDFTFVSIILPNDKNLSELLVGSGLANVVPPRSDDPFSKYLKQLSEAEDEAKKNKKGMHSSKTAVNPAKFTDYGDKRNSMKSKQFFEFVKNEPSLNGIVEAVLSGSLFKVRLEKQNCYVLFSLGGIRTLSLEKNVPQYERFAKEAVRFSKDQILQRDVELHLNSCTPKGVFQGALFVGKKNFAHTLLEQGLAYAETASKHEERYAAQYKTIEKVAEEKKIGIWGAGIPVRSSGGHTRGNTTKPLNETKTGTVTEVIGPDEFFVQFNVKKNLDTIEAELAKGKSTEGKLEQPVKKGIPCIAKFSEDGKWYRARIEKLISSTKFGVVFTDYGNYDEVDYDDIRKISPSLLAIAPLATKCALAYCEPSGKRTSTYEEAAERLRELIWEKTVSIQFAFEDATTKYGLVSEKKGDIKDTANARLIGEGLVRLIEDVVPLPNDQLAYLREEEEKARAKKLGGWGTSDFQEEDEY